LIDPGLAFLSSAMATIVRISPSQWSFAQARFSFHSGYPALFIGITLTLADRRSAFRPYGRVDPAKTCQRRFSRLCCAPTSSTWYCTASSRNIRKLGYESTTTASIVSSNRIVFNIKGNDYRLVVAVDFEKSIVWIKWIGTHKNYDKIDVKEVQHDG
jgi:hypothetical protein